MPSVPWRPVVTVLALTAVAIVGIVANQVEIAFLAIGALAGYLGKLNGAKEKV